MSAKALESIPVVAPVQPRPVAAPAPPAIYTTADVDVVPPVPVRQAMPSYPRPMTTQSQRVLDVVIDERGVVESAVLRGPVDPAYDPLVLAAARKWLYKPATRGGTAVKYRRMILVTLSPTPNDPGRP